MSGLVRRFLIFASIEGIVIQAHGHRDQHKSIAISYKTQQIIEFAKTRDDSHEPIPKLEAHGIIGLLNIANLPYLLAITKREEVARVYGKPIYLITDIAVLPLGSLEGANQAIRAALSSSSRGSDDETGTSGESEDESQDEMTKTDLAATPRDDVASPRTKNASSTSVAESVATRNVSFGRFASQWLSRQKPSTSNKTQSLVLADASTDEPKLASLDDAVTEKDNTEASEDTKRPVTSNETAPDTPAELATSSLVPRILRTIKMVFTSGSYFFSYDFDLTRRFERLTKTDQPLDLESLDPLYFWNRRLGASFLDSSHRSFLTPVLQGFVGQRTFRLQKGSEGSKAEVKAAVEGAEELRSSTGTDDQQDFQLTLISRRSTKRSGLRYLRRGIDDEGHCANFVETEQILSSADWDPSYPIRAFTQVRGSVPLYFSQSPYSFKPAVSFQNSAQMNEKAYNRHFQYLKQQYGSIQIALLVNHHGTEQPIGEAYERNYNKAKEQGTADGVEFDWFDFHHECRGMKFENVSRLVSKLDTFLLASKETTIRDGVVQERQGGVIRTNCMDCLDRTNVAQSAFAQHKLEQSLEADGYTIDFVKDPSTNWFNTLWADNGDAVSRQYASTAALKGDYTRTRKRNWRGAMNDFGLTISRYYNNMVNDYFSQAVIDVLLGNTSWKVFEDFESTMMSADPGISVQSGRQAAIDVCSKMVIADPDKEDLIHGWTMLVPAQENTLRTLPFEEAVVLLTDTALYCCKMDWSTEKIARYEKVDLRNVKGIKWGVYITSTFTQRQMDESVNQGVLIHFKPGFGDVVRVNTRSLQNYHVSDDSENHRQGVDGGTGLLSWLTAPVTRPAQAQDRIMALKIVPAEENAESVRGKAASVAELAESISDEIRRAITGSTSMGEQRGTDLVQNSDIISLSEAKKRTGYIEQVSHSLKRLVWA